MEPLEIIVIAAILIFISARLSGRVGVAEPLVLLVVGVAVSFIPGFPSFHIDPHLVLTGILPLLLYATAWRTPLVDFRREFLPVVVFAILLVAFSAFSVGFLLRFLIPDLPLAWGVAFGAILSPTDAVAVTIARRTGVSPRLITMLEGESLLNDATALVTLTTAVSIATSTDPTASSPLRIVGSFFFSVISAVIVGGVVGYASTLVRARIPDVSLDTAFSLVVPFVASIPTERLGGSGLVAAVIAGLVGGNRGLRLVPARHRLNSARTWDTMAFLLESGIFLAMGAQIPAIIRSVDSSEMGLPLALTIGFVLGSAVVACRTVIVVPTIALLHRRYSKLRAKVKQIDPGDVRNPKRFHRFEADMDFYCQEQLGPREATVLIWGGMRGAITLAAAQLLPAATPHRSVLILIAVLVAAGSLTIQGLTLDGMIRWVKPRMASDPDEQEQTELQELLNQIRSDTAQLENVQNLPRDLMHMASQMSPEQRKAFVEDNVKVLEAQREAILDLRLSGVYSTSAIARALQVLDWRAVALQALTEREN